MHDHFQGGCYTFAMEKAEIEECIPLPSFPSVTAGIVRWPMSVIRLTGPKEDVLDAAAFLYETWRTYSDPSVEIMAYSGDVPHNTITPIARRRGDLFELDIVLRNNRTSAEHPYGIFHPHEELHHIKKENIGLIEVMGLAVLPARLAVELETLADYLVHRTKKKTGTSRCINIGIGAKPFTRPIRTSRRTTSMTFCGTKSDNGL